MSKKIDFYFDFISPFSYLAHIKLPGLAKKYGYEIDYHPIDIPAAKIAAGNYGPSNREIPAKIKVLLKDLERWARRYNVSFKFPPALNCEALNAGTLFAKEKGAAEAYVAHVYDCVWGQGQDPTDTSLWKDIAEKLGWSANEFIDFVSSVEGRTAFRKACVEAHQRGVYGAPMMMIDDEIWWGNDRLDFVEDYMKTH